MEPGSEGHYVWNGPVRLHYTDRGDPSAPPLVFLRSGDRSAHTWDEVTAILSHQFRCIVADLTDHGGSAASHTDPPTVAEHVSDLATLVRALALPHLVLVGRSLGARVALAWADARPLPLSGIVLVNTESDQGPDWIGAGSMPALTVRAPASDAPQLARAILAFAAAEIGRRGGQRPSPRPSLTAPSPVGRRAAPSDLELRASDGNVLMAVHASAPAPNSRGILILPNVRGLHPYYRDLAICLASEGFETVAIDYYGRSAGSGDRTDTFPWPAHKARTDIEMVDIDVEAGVAYLRALPKAPRQIYVIGFSWGGSHALRQSAAAWLPAGAIGFYSYDRMTLVAPVAAHMTAPLLMIESTTDNEAERGAFEQLLRNAQVPHESHVFDAPHNFFDQGGPANSDATAAAWRLVLDRMR